MMRPHVLRRLVPSRSIACLCLVGLCGLVLLACQKAEEAPVGDHRDPDPAVDVAPRLEVPIVDDPQEAPRAPTLVGVLPGDFPDDLPIDLPSSIVDFGQEGESWVELLSAAPLGEVRAALRARLEAAGWRVASDPAGGYLLRQGERRARLTLRSESGTVYRYEY